MVNYYVLVGPYEHWQYALEHSVWGLRTASKISKGIWNRIEEGDYAILYCSGLKVIVGTARIVGKRTKSEPWWEEEIQKDENVFEYVIDLANIKLAVEANGSKASWLEDGIGDPEQFKITIGYRMKAANRLGDKGPEIYEDVLEAVSGVPPPPLPPRPEHDRIRDLIVHSGILQGLPSEHEYKIDNKRLDAIWKRIPQGNPIWAFEVQIGGDFFAAFAKLKHAWDLWNSKPVLVTTKEFVPEAENWLSGSFHEMMHACRVVEWRDMVRFHEMLVKMNELREKMGI